MIQRRSDGSEGWQPDARFTTILAADLTALLEAIVRRYGLIGAIVATNTGEVRARVGGVALEEAKDGFEAALAGETGSLKSLAGAIEGKALPRYFSQGELDAYADIPAPGLIALFMRKRPDPASERSELEMVSDYNVAKHMIDDLRRGMKTLS